MNRKHGYVITNGYMNNKKFNEVTQLYIEAADKLNIKLEPITTDEITYGIDGDEVSVKGFDYESGDFIIFLDKDIRLAKMLERKGIRLFNSSSVIAVCDDKSATFFALAGGGIAMPKTVVAPLVFPKTYQEEDAFIQLVEKELSYPFIIKESFGSFGEQVYMIHNLEELKAKRKELAYMPHIYQEFVTNSRGRDVRVHVVGDRVVASMLRTSSTDFRANISSGGSMERIELPLNFEALARKSARLIGADFVGVDLLFGEREEPILCEINSNAHIKNILECTGVNVADCIMAYIQKEVYGV